MKTEELKALGLDDEQVKSVMKLKGEYFSTLEQKVTDHETQITDMTTKLKEANDTIQSFKALDIEKIKTAAEDWETKYNAEKEQRDSDLFNYELDSIISKAGGRNPKLIKAGLDIDTIKSSANRKEDALKAIEAFKEEAAYMFDSEPTTPGVNVVKPGTQATSKVSKKDIIETTDPVERLKLIRENMEMFKPK